MKRNSNSRQDPLTALEDQERTQRRKFVRAARYTIERVPSVNLQRFIQEATALFRQFVPRQGEQRTLEDTSNRSPVEDQPSR